MTEEGILKPDMDSSVIEDEDNSDEEFSKFLFATKENLSRLTLNSSVLEDEDNSDEEFSKFLAATKENLSRLALNSKQNTFSAKAQMTVLGKQKSTSASLSANEESPKCLQNLTNRKCKSTSDNRSRSILGEEIESLPFMKNRTVYAQKLFEFFNEKVFKNQLPKDMPLLWNNNLQTTAGTTVCLKESGQYKCKINLSSKILTSYDRLQDTLLHEMCHAAVWIINKISNVCHGPLWQIWAARCNWILPNIEVPQRCHNYEISFPYFYKCVKCDWKCGRYKRSQKLSRALCPKCRSQLSLTILKS